MDVYYEQRSGHPSMLTDEILAKYENSVCEDQRLTLAQLHVLILEISRSLIHESITMNFAPSVLF